MTNYQVNKTYQEINDKIRRGQAVVVTAEEIIDIVRRKGEVAAARTVDVVTTGTFSPMCSSGAFINFGHAKPPIKASRVWLNHVPAYAGLAAVDVYIGVTEPCEEDPLTTWPRRGGALPCGTSLMPKGGSTTRTPRSIWGWCAISSPDT